MITIKLPGDFSAVYTRDTSKDAWKVHFMKTCPSDKALRRSGVNIVAPDLYMTGTPGHPLTPRDSELLASISTVIRLKKRETLYREGDRADALFYIVGGVMKMLHSLGDSRDHLVAFLFPSDLMGLAEEGMYVNSAVAVTAATLYRIPMALLEAMLLQSPNLDFHFLIKTAYDLRRDQRHAFLLSKRHAVARLGLFLQMLEHQQITHVKGSSEVYLPMTRSEIAAYTGVSLESVSRSFKELVDQGVISFRDRQHLKITDREKLEILIAERNGSRTPRRLVGV